jgi:hypothetical protein
MIYTTSTSTFYFYFYFYFYFLPLLLLLLLLSTSYYLPKVPHDAEEEKDQESRRGSDRSIYLSIYLSIHPSIHAHLVYRLSQGGGGLDGVAVYRLFVSLSCRTISSTSSFPAISSIVSVRVG